MNLRIAEWATIVIDSPFSGNIVIKDSLNDMALELVISDLDGTILETEDYHRRAYNVLFEELGLTRRWSREDYSARLATMGGGKFREIIGWLDQSEEDQEEVSRKLYARKTDLYVDLIVNDLRSGDLSPRPGVERLFEEILEQSSGFAIHCHLFPTAEMKNQLWLSGQCRSRFFKRYSKKTGKQGQSDALRLVFLNHSIQQVQDFTCFTCLKKPPLFIEGVCNTVAAQGFGQDFAFRCFAKENTNMMFFQQGSLILPPVMP